MRTMGRVKWFDAAKGLGCVVSDGGSQAALARAALAPFGLDALAAGAALAYEMKLTDDGLAVTEVYEIAGEARPFVLDPGDLVEVDIVEKIRGLQARRLPVCPGDSEPDEEAVCTWFSRPKGYGFVQTIGSSQDVFVHMDTLRREGMRELKAGQRVDVRVRRGVHGLVAAAIAAKKTGGKG